MKSGARDVSFAEIVEATVFSWKAICWKWNALPDYGSVVVIEQGVFRYFALVCAVETGSRDPGRVPFAYQKSFEELEKEQPQIFQLLQSSFELIPLGYQQKDVVFHILPSKPPLIHSFVRQANEEELKTFFKEFGFLDLIFSSEAKFADELLVCFVRFLSSIKLMNSVMLEGLFEKISSSSGADYRKFSLIAQRSEKLL